MKKRVLFIQGGGEGGYEAGIPLAEALQEAVGEDYKVNYPRMESDEEAPDFGWLRQIGEEISSSGENVIVVAHSLGASMVLKYLSEQLVAKSIAGIFLLAAPFWSGNEHWKQGLKLKEDFAAALPKNIRIFFYRCRDDDEVPVDHFAAYRDRLPGASFREPESGGHLFKGSLHLLVRDIKAL
ncbi:alpha/beta fold hydrolase [Hufsiella ginkgonis]|uniref:Alpha/beta hydrolase n=1 Tax=Hufsiella ginkgonis TaxID=2695274 RepID=A0A7K1XZY1_9SPHI|nr:alpha/beta fold hydrolase [Hufsiella ginkgonis]MXV16574.1 hypothetical protein [Hufsiella ginkgonis]